MNRQRMERIAKLEARQRKLMKKYKKKNLAITGKRIIIGRKKSERGASKQK